MPKRSDDGVLTKPILVTKKTCICVVEDRVLVHNTEAIAITFVSYSNS